MTQQTSAEQFSERMLAWQAESGRHDLPWQKDPTPYRVWLSEIMLQQTQVSTVVGYFERFSSRFPDVVALAEASPDEVLHLWSGLGYYSRARNLHKTAQRIVADHAGRFPDDVGGLCQLPGIGRSTAGAIVALAGDRRAAILDGNVKRVLARYHAVDGWPGESQVLQRLWRIAEAHLPTAHYRNYTQALMDLGATLCTRSKPACSRCPLQADCRAFANNTVASYPAARPRRRVPQRQTYFVIFENDQREVLLERRPASGIWGGLWCFPEALEHAEVANRARTLGVLEYEFVAALAPIKHTFTHFRLLIQPLRFRVLRYDHVVRDGDNRHWYGACDRTQLGLSKPVTQLLKSLHAGLG